jgi:hypothetical protein
MKSLQESLFDKDLTQKRILDKMDLTQVCECVTDIYKDYKNKLNINFYSFPPRYKSDTTARFMIHWGSHRADASHDWIYETEINFTARNGKSGKMWFDPITVSVNVRSTKWSFRLPMIYIKWTLGKYIYWDGNNPKDEDIINVLENIKNIFEDVAVM